MVHAAGCGRVAPPQGVQHALGRGGVVPSLILKEPPQGIGRIADDARHRQLALQRRHGRGRGQELLQALALLLAIDREERMRPREPERIQPEPGEVCAKPVHRDGDQFGIEPWIANGEIRLVGGEEGLIDLPGLFIEHPGRLLRDERDGIARRIHDLAVLIDVRIGQPEGVMVNQEHTVAPLRIFRQRIESNGERLVVNALKCEQFLP